MDRYRPEYYNLDQRPILKFQNRRTNRLTMDRYQILKEIDPFADKPNGDSCKYMVMGAACKGWRINETSVIVEINPNSYKYLQATKKAQIEINFKDKKEIFQIEKIITNSPYKASKQKGKINAHLVGKVLKITTPNYVVGKAR